MDFMDKYLKWIILGVVGLVGIILLIVGMNSCSNDVVNTTTNTTTTITTTQKPLVSTTPTSNHSTM